MAKRKRSDDGDRKAEADSARKKRLAVQEAVPVASGAYRESSAYIQIVTGSYHGHLHGVIAAVPSPLDDSKVALSGAEFFENFLFSSHSSTVRCLAVSPKRSDSDSGKLILASGGSDDTINLYQLSSALPGRLFSGSASKSELEKGLERRSENPKNRSLGTLNAHSHPLSCLRFASRSKLLSSSVDNTLAVTRTRDWQPLFSMRAPRPSGQPLDGADSIASGINSFAVHPSRRLAISVGKGEKCMRLWNLVTGKKAGVLGWGKAVLEAAGEGKKERGEGIGVEWDSEGKGFAVAFERGAVLFSAECKPYAAAVPNPPSKVHRIRFLARGDGKADVLCLSTEDGRIIFYAAERSEEAEADGKDAPVPRCDAVGTFGGKQAGIATRIKDFNILTPPSMDDEDSRQLIVAVGSDGKIHLGEFDLKGLLQGSRVNGSAVNGQGENANTSKNGEVTRRIGMLLGSFQTEQRVTCLESFLLSAPEEDEDDYSDYESINEDEGDESQSESESNNESSPSASEVDLGAEANQANGDAAEEEEEEFEGFD